ncbi:ORF108R [Infectious spleen and kidney necrosis virus]|uniref:ORF108R n=1 Tax=Infectious spleen and kidney necrosis virus (isolate Mandarin fish/China/Nanhai/1998) TaxID=654923 RepID=Q8QUK2_ISKNN|nr:ORF108R [Infectious spleen and kidney necrosis virus]AAL98832.1 ORF108R [Infectious spleen and kidney necrosis virus]
MSCHDGGTHKPGRPTQTHQHHMCQTTALWHIRRMAPSDWQTHRWPPRGP